ncbi:MAG TPA: L-seryl-tRNA(Sec) selenium transferase [Pedococcus sp.]|nr:L-seryl-tRNA(Sec) selenium transferase [Pedococcus sp.]
MSQPGPVDARRRVPRTDALLAEPGLAGAVARIGRDRVKEAVRSAQQLARDGAIDPSEVAAVALASLPRRSTSLTPVVNATGVVVHTNIGRAPLSPAAVEAMTAAAGYVDVELDLATAQRSRRGRGTLEALVAAVPGAEAALVVNNGAAALVLATTALAGDGREVLVSRGEMVEIGDGFRLPDLIASTGARLREVGTTNRTTLQDYAAATGPATGCVLKVHPSNFRVEGFTSAVSVRELATLGIPVVHDIGSGLLAPHRLLPDEPDAATAIRDGASVVTCSGDKLLGGPQAGIVLGRADVVERLRRHPLARAVRCDKTTLAALEATLRGPQPPVWEFLEADANNLHQRCAALAAGLPDELEASVVPSAGVVGGGGAPGQVLPGWAVSLPEWAAADLRAQDPPVLARVERGRCLVDLRCVPQQDDPTVATALARLGRGPASGR